MAFWGALALLPDADVLGFMLGIPYASPFGHRGATHSLVFAAAVGALVGLVASVRLRPALQTGITAALVVVSHPLLDTMTTGGLGCALLWPFDDTRFFAPFRPIPVAPMGLEYLSAAGMTIAAIEAVMFIPVFVFALWPFFKRSK
jgi:inner membrane protein